jgi:hypothetical protein
MSRPLNMSEVDWLKSEVARLSKQASAANENDIDKLESEINQWRSLLRELYELHVRTEDYQADHPVVQEVQRKLGLV